MTFNIEDGAFEGSAALGPFKEWSYGTHDRARYWREDAKDPRRSPFDRDRARILHSAGLRRLGTKTQVLVPGSDDFVRTRLTHSLEVAQVGRGLALDLGCNPDIVDAACLAHDLGHPPFGHNGERALDEVSSTIGGFEGNAQTFRLVARLETKVIGEDNTPGGLNLTRATLDALTKYPWARGKGPDPAKSALKYGFYADDAAVFNWMRTEAPRGRRCLEAQVMDYSDDIGYSVHDLEDAVVTGHLDLATLPRGDELDAVVASTLSWYGDVVGPEQLLAAAHRLLDLPFWPTDYDGSYRSRAEMKDLTSQLIGRFISATTLATRQQYGPGPLGRYGADLVIPAGVEAEIALLKGIAVHYVMSPRESEPLYYQQRTIIHDLVAALLERGPKELEPPFAEEWHRADDDAGRLRAVVDQVACLTDVSANQWHARLCGLLSTLL